MNRFAKDEPSSRFNLVQWVRFTLSFAENRIPICLIVVVFKTVIISGNLR